MYPAARRTFRTSLDPVDGSLGPQKSSGQRPREKATREQPQPRNIKASSQKRYRGRVRCSCTGM
jgi:hypothetical protein